MHDFFSKWLFLIPLFLCVAFLGEVRAAKPTGKLASYGVSRTWEDAAGTFRIEAKLIEADPSSTRLERSDGKVSVVPMDKLSKKDQEFVREFLKADELEQANQEKKKSFRPIPLGQYEYVKTKPLELSFFRPYWRASEVTPMNLSPGIDMAVDIQLPPGNGFQLFAAGGKPTVYLNAYRMSDGIAGTSFSLLGKIRFPDGAPTIISDSSTPWRILALTPDGKRFAAYHAMARTPYISIWESTPEGVDPLFQFQVGFKPNALAYFNTFDIASACFVNSNQLLTLTPSGDIHSWSVKPKTVNVVASVPGARQIKIGGKGDLIAVSLPGRIVLLNGTLKEQVGLILTECDDFASMAFSPSGKFLAVCTPFIVRVYRLSDGEIHAGIPVPTQDSTLPLDWVGDHLLLNKQLLLDVENKLPIWKYLAPDDAIAEFTPNRGMLDWNLLGGGEANEATIGRNGTNWDVRARVGPNRGVADQNSTNDPRQAVWAGQLFTMFRNQSTSIVATTLPHDGALEAIKNIDIESMIALKPGCNIQIDEKLDGATEQDKSIAIQALESSFKHRGWNIRQGSENRVTVAARKLPSRKLPLKLDGPNDVSYSPIQYSITIQVGDQKVFDWNTEVHVLGTTLTNESAQQFVDRVTRFNPNYFANAVLPTQILWPKYQWGIGESKIEPSAQLVSKLNEAPEMPVQPTRRRRN